MQIELATLEKTRGEFNHVYNPGELSSNDERVRLAGPTEVSGRITRSPEKIRVKGKIKGAAQVECDRCLQEVELPINLEFDLEYVSEGEYKRLHAAELLEEDLNLSVFDGEMIDIDEFVREQVLLAVPSQVLCDDNCKGLCEKCGANRNLVDCVCETQEMDPRWAELKKLVNGK
jgi:DUF177 domain-containing protein